MIVTEINPYECIEFTQKHHYSKVMPKLTKHYLGLIVDGEIVGTLTLGWGTQPKQTIRKILPNHQFGTDDYFEIGKMCVHDKMPRNTETQFLSKVVKWLKENTDKKFLYTLADGIVGKVGYVYQAFNFYYGGWFETPVYMGVDGEKIHPRTSRRLLIENAKFLGKEKLYWLTPDFMKTVGIRRIQGRMFRYLKPLNKKCKKILDRYDTWVMHEYPKEVDLQWREQVEKGKYIVLDGMPNFKLDVVNENKNNVFAHKKNGSINTFFE